MVKNVTSSHLEKKIESKDNWTSLVTIVEAGIADKRRNIQYNPTNNLKLLLERAQKGGFARS